MVLNYCSYKINMSFTFSTWLVLILMALLSANLNLQFPCLTSIRDELDTCDFMMQLTIIIGPGLAILSNVVIGFLSYRHGSKNLFLGCVVSFSCGSLICALSGNIFEFLLGRSLQVLGDSGISVVGFVILSRLLPDELKLGKYLGFNTILSSIVAILSPLIGAWVLVHYHWQWNLLLLFALSFIICVLFYFYLPETIQTGKKLNNTASNVFFQEIWYLLNLPLFFLIILIPALYACIASLFEMCAPFIFIDVFGFTPSDFSLLRMLHIFMSVLASIAYVYVLKGAGVRQVFTLGELSYFGYIIILLIFLLGIFLSNESFYPYFLFALPAMLGVSLSFVNPISMLKALSCSEGKKDIGLALFALMRNVLSTIFMLLSAFFFNKSNYLIIIFIILGISLIILFLLLSLKKYIFPF